MRKVVEFSIFALGTLSALAQTPIRDQYADPSPAKMASIPNFVLPAIYKDRTAHPLPTSVDNTKKPWMAPYGWTINGWSCANATAVSFVYNYEVQRVLNLPSAGQTPLFTYEYTYHFLNHGNQAEGGDGWDFVDAFDILKETGGATSTDFGGFEYGDNTAAWMSGYDKYYNAMKVRAAEYYKIDASVASADELIKQVLLDHGDGSPDGGLLTFQANSENWTTSPGGQGGIPVFTKLGGGGGHALTICGYDDAVSGGSYLVANNWGDGLYWAPYKLFRAGQGLATSNNGTPVMFVKMKHNYKPQLTFKITISHSQRNSLAIMTGVAPSASASTPTKTKDYAGAFNMGGGANPIGGKGVTTPIEIGLDLTDFVPLLTGKDAKFFLQLVSKGGSGTVTSLALEDYTSGTVKEIPCTETNKSIGNGTTLMSVAWTGSVGVLMKNLQENQGFHAFASPNPARRGGEPVQIAFAGAGATSASLIVRDISGQVIHQGKMKLNGSAAADVRSFSWDLKNAQGSRVSQGVYYATVETADAKGALKSSTSKLKVVE